MVVGNLVHRASEAMRKALVAESGLNSKYTAEQFRRAVTRYIKAHGHCRFDVTYQEPEGIRWDDSTYQGDAYGTFAWATYVAEVSVDMVTFETKVEDFVALQEIGRVVNPTLAEGQIQGGVTQGIGWAVSEKIVWKDGRMANPTLSNYVIPTALDTPPIRVAFEEVPYAHGPQGAKGIGELPLDGSAAAVASAIEHALGARVTSIPATPEVLFERMKGVRS
jgi:CO/xanthine dehydrogenase Mo-binding subunit